MPYDIPDVEISQVSEKCSFDAFVEKYDIQHPALHQIAAGVRGADTSRLDLTPQSHGLYAISLGLSALFEDDHDLLRHGMVTYDELYAWCRGRQDETHDWPPRTTNLWSRKSRERRCAGGLVAGRRADA